jgi:hypothetical protein
MNEIYNYTVPTCINFLTGLKNVMAKSEAFAKEQGISDADMLAKRLAPDMFVFTKQVQIAADHAKGLVKRLTDLEVPAFEDTETTFAELQARVDKTIAFLQTVPADAFAHSGDKKVEISYFPGKYILGFDYVREVAMPNFFFHITTAYDIMRNAGVQLGKSDLAGHQSFHDLPAAEVASA